MNEAILIVSAFLTSLITAVFGVGGGLLLIAIMPGLIPTSAIVPIHSAGQVISNLSRALFVFKTIHWEFAAAFFIGSCLGGVIGIQFIDAINVNIIPLLIAAFILFNVWGKELGVTFSFKNPPKGELFSLGFIQTGLGVIVGATGPLAQSTLLRKGLDRDALISTSALFMTMTHLIKLAMFGFIGFNFVEYWKLILGISIAVILGSLVGTLFRKRVPNAHFKFILKLLLTFLAIRMIFLVLSS